MSENLLVVHVGGHGKPQELWVKIEPDVLYHILLWALKNVEERVISTAVSSLALREPVFSLYFPSACCASVVCCVTLAKARSLCVPFLFQAALSKSLCC